MPDREGTSAIRSSTVVVDGLRTHYLEAGPANAPILLLLHDGAWGGSAEVSWGRCLPDLARRFHVIAPDFYGFGASDKVIRFDRAPYEARIAQLVAVLAVLGVTEPLHVVGTSFGGSVALRLLQSEALALRSVVSIGGSGGPWKTSTMLDELGRWDGTPEDLARVVRFLMDETEDFDDQVALRRRAASVPGHFRALASPAMPVPPALRAVTPPVSDDWPRSLTRTEVPTLLVAGQRDVLFESIWPDEVARESESATVLRIDARHSPNLDHPAMIAEIIADFVASAERS